MSDASITSILRYEKPRAAADWLRDAFGLHVQHIEEDGDGDVSYISLNFGDSGILICPTDSPLLETLVVQPNEIGDRSTQICYLTVDDVASHCAAARKHGARIEREPLADDAGRRFYVCRDLEGHLWSFGNRAYTEPAHPRTRAPPPQPQRRVSHAARASSLLTVAVFAATIGGGAVLYLVKEGRGGLPTWLNTFVIEAPSRDVRAKQQASGTPRTTAPARVEDETEIARLRAQLEAMRARSNQGQADLLRQFSAQQASLEKARARATQLAATVTTLEKKLEADASAQTAATVRLERLNRQAQHESVKAKRALAAARQALTRTTQANATFETRIARLVKQLNATTQTLKTVRTEKEKIVAKLNRITTQAKAKQRAENIVSERVAEDERAQFKATIEALNTRLQRVLETMVKVRREKQQVDRTLGTTKQQAEQKLAAKEKRLVELADAYQRVGEALKDERLTLDQIVHAFNTTKSQLVRVQKAEKKLSEELSKTKAQLKNSRNDLKVKVAILQWLDLEAEVQRAERALQRKRREPPPPLPARKGPDRSVPAVAAPRSHATAPPKPKDNATANTGQTCAHSARRQLSNFLGWRSASTTSAIEFLCRGAETSSEPVACFRKVIWGTASWGRGGNRPWSVKDALNLCSGTLSARHTLLCLKRQLRARTNWRVAIEQCTTNW